MEMKPMKAELAMTFNAVDAQFKVTNLDGTESVEFKETSNILLHDVTIDENGTITGTYIKPDSLKYYENNVDKEAYPTFFEWSAFSDERERLFDESQLEYVNSAWLMVDGYVSPEFDNKETRYKKAFFQIRRGFNEAYANISMMIYK